MGGDTRADGACDAQSMAAERQRVDVTEARARAAELELLVGEQQVCVLISHNVLIKYF